MTAGTGREWASPTPYGAGDQRTDFTSNRIAIEKLDGTVVKERSIRQNVRRVSRLQEIDPWREGDELWRGLRVTIHRTLRATAENRISTSALILCFAGTITMWKLLAASRRPNMSSIP